MDLAIEKDLAIGLMARVLLSAFYATRDKVESGSDPASAALALGRDDVSKRHSKIVTRAMERPHDVGLPPWIADQVADAVGIAGHYAPVSGVIRRIAGVEYEHVLQEHVANAGLSYVSEKKLTELGQSIPPDMRLDVPILVVHAGEHKIINWIESKASFGDPSTIKHDSAQFVRYRERAGPGLVIYWFGIVACSLVVELAQEGVLLMDGFPPHDHIVQIDPSAGSSSQ